MSLTILIHYARTAALALFSFQDIPPASVVEAIIQHESQGNPHLCKNENDGSSSRGLVQINRKHSRCCPEDDKKYRADYDPATNLKYGVWLLAFQSQWAREHHFAGDPLQLYAGRGPAAVRFAREIREAAKQIEAERETQ